MIPKLMSLIWNGKKIIILVILYSISNTLPFFAIPRIGAPAFTVCSQLKILTTAIFGTVLLKKVYSFTQWRALLLLVLGCILVISPILSSDKNENLHHISYFQQLLGLCATLLQATISGFSAVYLESLLKDKDDNVTIWERNFQLAFYSIVFLLLSVLSEGFIDNILPSTVLKSIRSKQLNPTSSLVNKSSSTQSTSDSFIDILFSSNLFHGWTYLTVLTVILLSCGGLLVAATLKYADAVLKCFATAISIILVSIVGFIYLGDEFNIYVSIGMMVTVISMLNYTFDYTFHPHHPNHPNNLSSSINSNNNSNINSIPLSSNSCNNP